MRHHVAVRRLRTIAQRCQHVSAVWADDPFLIGGYAFGDVLEPAADVPVVQVAFVLNLLPDELPWGTEPQSCAGLPHVLEMEKAPVEWYWRPTAWPVSNHTIRRPLRIWSLDGVDTAALDALDRGAAEPLRLPESSPVDLERQLATELVASLAHLRKIHAGYWNREWRSANRGSGVYPENHLWDAVLGYLDLLDATA